MLKKKNPVAHTKNTCLVVRGQRGIMFDLKLNNFSISDEFWILAIISIKKNTLKKHPSKCHNVRNEGGSLEQAAPSQTFTG